MMSCFEQDLWYNEPAVDTHAVWKALQDLHLAHVNFGMCHAAHVVLGRI